MPDKMMKALAITKLGERAELIEMNRPRAAEDSVVIRTAYSGVSAGTEMWIGEGKRHDYGPPPFINGYQATGTVVEVGEKRKDSVNVGDEVAVFCLGAHAEYVMSHGDLVYKLQGKPSLKPCSMFVQPSVAANAWNLAEVNTGDTVYIVGQGLVGQCAAYIARLRGAYAIVSDISAERIRRSRSCCADWVIDSAAVNARDEIMNRFPGGVDVVAESTGLQTLLNDAISACKVRGKFVFMGWYPGDVSYHYQLAHARELYAYYPVFIGPRTVQEGIIRLIESGELGMNRLISHEIPWEHSAEVYNQLFTDRRNSFNGIVIKWE